MSWNFEFVASTKEEADRLVSKLIDRNAVPMPIGDQVRTLITMLPDNNTNIKTVVHVKSWGHVGEGSSQPNVHHDIRMIPLDRV